MCAQVLVLAGGAAARASQAIVSALVQAGASPSRASQIAAQVLIWNHEMPTPAVYPALAGLSYGTVKRPMFYNGQQKSGSGWSVRIGYASTPTWEWDLTYDALVDSRTPGDMKTLLGFFLATSGNLLPFLFEDPDDHAVTAQPIGTTDGATTNWTLVRTFGEGGATGTEPVGFVNPDTAFNLYLNGTLQSPSSYSVITSTPVAQQIKFSTAPATGQTITVDINYYFYVNFKDPTNDFENFAHQFWAVKKVTLQSLRG